VIYNGYIHVSQQNTNLNHTPTDAGDTWWKPEWQTVDGLTQVKSLSGGGALTARWENVLEDAGTYTLPLANSVPIDTFILISKSDLARNLTPAFDCSGADTIAYLGGTCTGINMDVLWGDTIRLYSNGSNQWST
jgi:hypothetical protein